MGLEREGLGKGWERVGERLGRGWGEGWGNVGQGLAFYTSKSPEHFSGFGGSAPL